MTIRAYFKLCATMSLLTACGQIAGPEHGDDTGSHDAADVQSMRDVPSIPRFDVSAPFDGTEVTDVVTFVDAGSVDVSTVVPVDAAPSEIQGHVRLTVSPVGGTALIVGEAAFNATTELLRSPLMIPGAQCSIERIGDCHVYTNCGRGVPQQSAGTISLQADAIAIQLMFGMGGYNNLGTNQAYRAGTTLTVRAAGAEIPAWMGTSEIPSIPTIIARPPASIDRAVPLTVNFAPSAGSVGRPGLVVGNTFGPMVACSFAANSASGTISPALLSRITAGAQSIVVVGYNESIIQVGTAHYAVSVLATGARSEHAFR